MNPISFDSIKVPSLNGSGASAGVTGKAEGASFGEWLDRSLQSVNKLQAAASESSLKLVSGAEMDIHGTMIAMQKASVGMSLLLEVRNKLISAYDEVKRMQF
jgi:flagellar hook-basal body complex protein FliE